MNFLNLLPIEENLRAFFAYTAGIAIAYMVLATITLTLFKGPISDLHSKIFGVSKEQALSGYFSFLANFKIASLILFIIPYIAIVLIGQN